MSEIRKNIFNSREVVIADKRTSRPNDFKDGNNVCPFCYGNEDMTPKTKDEIIKDGKWIVRAIDNLYPIYDEHNVYVNKISDLEVKLKSVGSHEVIIDTNNHEHNFYNMKLIEFNALIEMYVRRYKKLLNEEHTKYVSIVKNFGAKAAASRAHSHSQIISFPFVPNVNMIELNNAHEYYSKHGKSIYSDFISKELMNDERVISDGKYFITLATYAAEFHYQTEIICKNSTRFEDMTDSMKQELAFILFSLFRNYSKIYSEFPFNMFFHTHPKECDRDEYNFHLHICPRVNNHGGIELSSGVYILGIKPEDFAKKLKF